MSAMSARMKDSPVREVMQAIRSDSEQNLKEVRHSFITTPMRVYTTLLAQVTPPGEPQTWLAIAKLCAFLIWYGLLTVLSLGSIYGMAVILTAVASLSKPDAQYRLQRPRPDQVKAVATLLGIIHVSVLFTLVVLFGLEPPVSYPVLVGASLGGIAVLFGGLVLGGVVLVACWKMLKATCRQLYWPSASELGVVNEKERLRVADRSRGAALVDSHVDEDSLVGEPTDDSVVQ